MPAAGHRPCRVGKSGAKQAHPSVRERIRDKNAGVPPGECVSNFEPVMVQIVLLASPQAAALTSNRSSNPATRERGNRCSPDKLGGFPGVNIPMTSIGGGAPGFGRQDERGSLSFGYICHLLNSRQNPEPEVCYIMHSLFALRVILRRARARPAVRQGHEVRLWLQVSKTVLWVP